MSNPFVDADGTAHYPIVFVRGFAMTDGAIEHAVQEPFSGFEQGSTLLRQGVSDKLVALYFESPVVRLITEYGYEDVYRSGREPDSAEDLEELKDPLRTLWVYRYYEQTAEVFGGDGERKDIEVLADGLHTLIERIRSLYGDLGERTGQDYLSHFKVLLVAHSMGGLIVRSYLQKILPERVDDYSPDQCPVDKTFTYGTPHNGIELRVIGNKIPVGWMDISNFHRPNMADYLGLSAWEKKQPVHSLDGKFPPERFFCLIGTNERDYDVKGSAAAVGAISDGLVRINNAYTKGSPRAHVHRSHGGPVGIVNSEDGYQNLRRFFFGDTRVDGKLDVQSIILPKEIEDSISGDERRKVEANFYFETVLSMRTAKGWQLSRRKFDEQSASRREIGKFFREDGTFQPSDVFLFSTFLSRSILKQENRLLGRNRSYMAFVLDLGVFTDRFEIDRRWWLDEHYDGVHFLHKRVFIQLGKPKRVGDNPMLEWPLRYSFDRPSSSGGKLIKVAADAAGTEFRIPITSTSGRPGFSGDLVLTAYHWK